MKDYQTFVLSDEPKLIGIPITTGIPVLLLTTIGLLTGHALPLFIAGAISSLLMHYQFGGLPIRQFWGVIYWSLPRFLTVFLFQKSPNSANRLYIR